MKQKKKEKRKKEEKEERNNKKSLMIICIITDIITKLIWEEKITDIINIIVLIFQISTDVINIAKILKLIYNL